MVLFLFVFLYFTALHRIVLYCIVLYCIVLDCFVLYYLLLLFFGLDGVGVSRMLLLLTLSIFRCALFIAFDFNGFQSQKQSHLQ